MYNPTITEKTIEKYLPIVKDNFLKMIEATNEFNLDTAKPALIQETKRLTQLSILVGQKQGIKELVHENMPDSEKMNAQMKIRRINTLIKELLENK